MQYGLCGKSIGIAKTASVAAVAAPGVREKSIAVSKNPCKVDAFPVGGHRLFSSFAQSARMQYNLI